jgi:hypothetical protein
MDNLEKVATFGYIRHTTKAIKTKKHNTTCVGHHYAPANTNSVNKTKNPLRFMSQSIPSQWKWCCHASVFHTWAKCKPSDRAGRSVLSWRTVYSWTLHMHIIWHRSCHMYNCVCNIPDLVYVNLLGFWFLYV